MTNALYVARRFGNEENGEWAPVGLLEREDGVYRFQYTNGALRNGRFVLFPGMSNPYLTYESESLLPLFGNRLMPRSRPEYRAYLAWSGFESEPDPLAILGVTEGIRQTDQIEVFPRPVENDQKRYSSTFFVHGIRMNAAPQPEDLSDLAPGTQLVVVPEPSNESDPHAVAVHLPRAAGALRIGYVPRYLAPDVVELLELCEAGDVSLRVARVNLDAPSQMRLLCSFDACWPPGFYPCSGREFKPLVPIPLVTHVASGG